jgi:hypothetical protein
MDRKSDPNVRLLDEIYKNAKMGVETNMQTLPDVRSMELKSELTSQIERFEAYAKRAGEMLGSYGVTPKEENVFARMMVRGSIAVNTIADDTTPHIAEMVSRGLDVGVSQLAKTAYECRERGCSTEVASLAEELIAFERSAAARAAAIQR